MDRSKFYNDLLVLAGICESEKPLNYPSSISKAKESTIRNLLLDLPCDGLDIYKFIGSLLDEKEMDVGYLLGFLEFACALVKDERIRMDYCTLIMAKLGFKGLLDDH